MEMFTKPAKPVFRKLQDEELFLQLRTKVNNTISSMQLHSSFLIYLKAVLFPVLYFGAWVLAMYFANFRPVFLLLYAFMGFMLVVNYLTLIHEAVHATIFQSKKLNKWYVYIFDLMGANSFIFRVRHVRLHHNYPNVMGWDSDFEQSPMARVFPQGKYNAWHKYQHIYLPILYPLYLLNWLLIRDFKDYFNKQKLVWKVTTIPTIEYLKLFLFKFIFIGYVLLFPKFIIGLSWGTVIAAFLIMMFTASIISLIVLLPPHANLDNAFPMPDENGKMPTSWFLHQLSCTNDVEEDNWFIRFFMGSFNYHIAHHLFPNVHHIYYPAISKEIAEFSKQHQLPYKKIKLKKALLHHYELLKNNAFHENIFEETM